MQHLVLWHTYVTVLHAIHVITVYIKNPDNVNAARTKYTHIRYAFLKKYMYVKCAGCNVTVSSVLFCCCDVTIYTGYAGKVHYCNNPYTRYTLTYVMHGCLSILTTFIY